MANSIKNKVNLNFIEAMKGLSRKRYPIYESENMLIYTPAIQSNESKTDREGVDISIDNMAKIFDESRITLLIIRYFESFIVIEGSELYKKLKYHKRDKKWSFKVKRFNDRVELSLSDFGWVIKNLEIFNKDEFIKHMVDKYGLNFNQEIINKEIESDEVEDNIESEIKAIHEPEELYETVNSSSLINQTHTYITSKGFNYSLANIKNLYLSLRSKPFVIISGISGTGKTKIVQLFAESIGATEDNGQFMLVPVRPDWSDGSELLGYKDIKGDFNEGPLTKLIRHAIDYPERPHFLLLDEMNLARVEYYFSDILSVMESRKLVDGEYTSSSLHVTDEIELHLPGNLYIIGTVNMDETTHPFSKKVLDRANTIEFNEIDLNSFTFLNQQPQIELLYVANESLQANYIQLTDMYESHEQLVQKISGQLAEVNEILKTIHAQVGYRVRDEICFYMAHNAEGEMLLSESEALDFCYMQKLLPRIAGSGERVETVLTELLAITEANAYRRSTEKLLEMLRRLRADEFTSFWIS